MGAMASQITSLTIVYSTVYSGADQRKHQSSASLAFLRGIHRWPVNSPHKGSVTRKMFPFDDVIMIMGIPMLERWHIFSWDGALISSPHPQEADGGDDAITATSQAQDSALWRGSKSKVLSLGCSAWFDQTHISPTRWNNHIMRSSNRC